MSASISSPPMRMLRATTMPPRLMTATSVVPPPMSMIMLPVGSLIGQAGADRGRHRLLDQTGPARAGVHGRVADGALLDLGHARRNAEEHAGPRHHADPVVNLADEVGDHLLRHVEVADDSVAERSDGDDARRRSTDHSLGLGADGQNLPGLGFQGDDAGLADDDAAVADLNQGVGRAQVDPDVSREEAEQGVQAEHDSRLFLLVVALARPRMGTGLPA